LVSFAIVVLSVFPVVRLSVEHPPVLPCGFVWYAGLFRCWFFVEVFSRRACLLRANLSFLWAWTCRVCFCLWCRLPLFAFHFCVIAVFVLCVFFCSLSSLLRSLFALLFSQDSVRVLLFSFCMLANVVRLFGVSDNPRSSLRRVAWTSLSTWCNWSRWHRFLRCRWGLCQPEFTHELLAFLAATLV